MQLNEEDVANMVNSMVRERTESKFIKRILLMMVIMSILIVGASVGLSWAVAIYTRDTQVGGRAGAAHQRQGRRGSSAHAAQHAPPCRVSLKPPLSCPFAL